MENKTKPRQLLVECSDPGHYTRRRLGLAHSCGEGFVRVSLDGHSDRCCFPHCEYRGNKVEVDGRRSLEEIAALPASGDLTGSGFGLSSKLRIFSKCRGNPCGCPP